MPRIALVVGDFHKPSILKGTMTSEEVAAALKEMSFTKEGIQDVITLVWDPKFDNDTYSLICRRLIATVFYGYKNDNV